jgi:hypothetical protein
MKKRKKKRARKFSEKNQIDPGLIPVILPSWDIEIWRTEVPAQPGQGVLQTLSQSIAGRGGMCMSSQAMREAEIIRRTVVQNSPGRKVCKTLSQWKKSWVCWHRPVISAMTGS